MKNTFLLISLLFISNSAYSSDLDNTLEIIQNGELNSLSLMMNGYQNNLEINQFGFNNTISGFNENLFQINGNFNNIYIHQEGSNNIVNASINSSYNFISITQIGNGNQAYIIQK